MTLFVPRNATLNQASLEVGRSMNPKEDQGYVQQERFKQSLSLASFEIR